MDGNDELEGLLQQIVGNTDSLKAIKAEKAASTNA
jgi:predicted component of type VI protein secretion system